MRLRGTVTTALTLAALAATPSLAQAAPALASARPLTWTDAAGDANGLNSQGGLLPAGPDNTATPVSIASDDITSVTFARTDDSKAVTGLKVTMTLTAAPAAGALYRVTGAADGCSTFWFQYTWTVGGAPLATLRNNCGVTATTTNSVSGGTVSTPITAAVVGTSIVWTVPLAQLPAGIIVGSALKPALGEVRAVVGAAGTSLLTAPVIDQTPVQSSTYAIGQ